ncbi:HAMP domain-containing protein [bacterium]|nr:HAMP domain-containing protein [bacterium]
MRRRKLLWHLFPSYLLITAIAVTAVSWYSFDSVRRFYLEETAAALTARARLLEERARPLTERSDADALDSLAKKLGAAVSTRITVISPDGVVLADSEEDPAAMDNHGDRPEIVQALTGEVGESSRYSYTLQTNMMYVAIPISSEMGIAGVVRTAVPLTAVEEQLRAVRTRIALAAVLLLVLSAVVSLAVSRRIAGPLHQMQLGAERFAGGDFAHDVPVPHPTEFASLAESMNGMAADLDARIRTVVQQKAEQEAVLASMSEGVVAIDREAKVITMNRAAEAMLHIEVDSVRGRAVQELIRNVRFHEIAASVLENGGLIEGEITLAGQQETVIEASGAPMRRGGGEIVGAVIVLNDVTKLRRLERVRRDFVANVSHELRTPVTSIKGFVETLRDEVGRDGGNSARFLDIIIKHVDRLNAIIEDLLYLSRIEEDAGRKELVLESISLFDALSSVVAECQSIAEERDVDIRLTADRGLEVRLNRQLFEHAVVNLLDNAIKYSSPGSEVEVSANREGGETVISVRDHGLGIAEEHQSRIFERFYQVDKGRSREMGGTGLGLSIARHIVQAHGGSISVESSLRQGSTFHIHIPDTGSS